jgi:hypothetical protein
MTIPDYSPFTVQSDKMFYVLDVITSVDVNSAEDLALVRRTPAGDEPFTEYTAHKLQNGHILLAFPEHFRIATQGNLVAIAGGISEIVNLQLYERLRGHYDLGTAMPTGEKGVFCFLDSQPIHDPKDEWRCDTTAYGPLKYLAPDEERRTLLSQLAQIKVYEPVLCVNGIAHLVYLHREDDSDAREFVVNQDPVPFVGVTLSEALKLIYEWATVSEPPFSNAEDIARDAKDFLAALHFDPLLIDYQADMQVARYLLGNPDARRRPDDAADNTDDLRTFLKRRVAHGSLAATLALYPGSGDIQQAAQIDLATVESDYASTLFYFQVDPQGHTLAEAERGIAAIDGTRLHGAQDFMRRKVAALREKQAIALALLADPAASF